MLKAGFGNSLSGLLFSRSQSPPDIPIDPVAHRPNRTVHQVFQPDKLASTLDGICGEDSRDALSCLHSFNIRTQLEYRLFKESWPLIPDRDVAQRVDLHLTIETPENVVLTYQLAGPSVRCAAYLLDLLLRLVLLFFALMVLGPMTTVLPGLGLGALLVFMFLLEWGYFVICEGFFNGKSVGKHVFGLRVIQEGGTPISFWSALLRNLARAADALPFLLHGVGFVSMLLTKNFQRLGDLLAGTVVITERRVVLPREPIIVERIEPFSREELGGRVPSDQTLTAIDEFLGRRYVLTHERGHQLASMLAGRLASWLGFQGDRRIVEKYPMAFLARVYVTFRQTGED